ncbi:MAG: TetR/AcrR family transcriptional regulator [Ruminococcaceae bacterium]|nr:TetR/AcrR family transcriptional regulator [Oscillospiraceae bacterium]
MAINDNDIRVRRTKKLLRKGVAELGKTKSVNKITVKELTDLVEINRGTFYLHYKDVYDLVDSIENELCEEFDQKVLTVTPDDILHRPVDVLETFFDYFKTHRDIINVLMGENGDAKFVYRFGELMNVKILELFKQIFPNMSMERYDFAYNYGKFGYVGILHCWATQYPHLSSREIAEKTLSLNLGGLWGILGDEGKEVLLNAHNSH